MRTLRLNEMTLQERDMLIRNRIDLMPVQTNHYDAVAIIGSSAKQAGHAKLDRANSEGFFAGNRPSPVDPCVISVADSS